MVFDKNYYVNSTISNYEDYRKKDFTGLADDLFLYLVGKSVLDYGAATGGLVFELKQRNIHCIGTDISEWAIEYGRNAYGLSSEFLHNFNPFLLKESFDVVLFLDVLEHIEDQELEEILSFIVAKELVVRIPVTAKEGEDFVLDVSKKDKTHVQKHSKTWWLHLFNRYGFHLKTVLRHTNIYDSKGVLSAILINIYRR